MLCLPPALPLLPPSGPQTLPNLPLSCSLAPRSRSRDGSLSRFHLELQLALKDRPSLVLKRNCNINSSHESPDRSSETTRQARRLRSACLFLFLGLERVSERQRSCCRREVARLGSSRLGSNKTGSSDSSSASLAASRKLMVAGLRHLNGLNRSGVGLESRQELWSTTVGSLASRFAPALLLPILARSLSRRPARAGASRRTRVERSQPRASSNSSQRARAGPEQSSRRTMEAIPSRELREGRRNSWALREEPAES